MRLVSRQMIKFITAGTLAFLMFLSLTACGEQNSKTATETEENTFQAEELLHSFESINELFSMDATGRFGRVTLNDNTKFITEGVASAKLEVYGDYYDNNGSTSPILKIMLNTGNDYAYPDFMNVKAITFDLFNESGREQTVDISLTFADEASSTATTEYKKFVLKEGLNQVTYELTGSLLGVSHDLTKMASINLRFEKSLDMKEEPYLFYLDKVVLQRKAVAWEPYELVQKENEICSFDNEIQVGLIKSNCVGPGMAYAPQLSLNQELLYCKNYEGTSLKCVMPAGTKSANSWPYMGFNSLLFEKYNLTEMALEGKELVFDIYNTGSAYNLGIEYKARHDGKTIASGSKAITAETGWTEIRLPLTALYECTGELNGEDIRLTDPGMMNDFRISWCEFVGDDKVMYFDNFRFE